MSECKWCEGTGKFFIYSTLVECSCKPKANPRTTCHLCGKYVPTHSFVTAKFREGCGCIEDILRMDSTISKQDGEINELRAERDEAYANGFSHAFRIFGGSNSTGKGH